MIEVVIMAARLTDRQKKKIVADYLELGSYNATAKRNGVSDTTVKRIIVESGEITEKLEQKKEENTADILAYMEEKRKTVCEIIEVGLSVLPEKIKTAKSASEVTTALGTLIDKFSALNAGRAKQETESMTLSEKMAAIREAARNIEY